MTAASFVDARHLGRVFDVSKPWLNRLLEGGQREFLRAVDDVTFGMPGIALLPRTTEDLRGQ